MPESKTRKRPTKRTAPTKVSPISQIKKRSAAGLVELPSGIVIKMRAVGMEPLITAGLIPNSLLPIVEEALKKGKRGKEVGPADVLSEADLTPKLIQDMMLLFDNVTCFVVTEPIIHPTPEAGALREDDLVYVDELDIEDKTYIYQVAVAGTADLERFRREYRAAMDAVPGREDVVVSPKRPSGTKRKR